MNEEYDDNSHGDAFVIAPNVTLFWRNICLGASLVAVMLGGLLAGL